MIMLKTAGNLKTSKLSCMKLEQVPRDYGVSCGHKNAGYSCAWNTGPQGLSMLGRCHLGNDVSCEQEPQKRRPGQGRYLGSEI